MKNYTNDKLVIKGRKFSSYRRLNFQLVIILIVAVYISFSLSSPIGEVGIEIFAKEFFKNLLIFIAIFSPVAFFLFLILVGIIGNSLILTEKGFILKQIIFSTSYKWKDVKDFSYVKLDRKTDLITFKFQKVYKKRRILRAISNIFLFIGGKGFLAKGDTFSNSYEIETKKLVETLNQWQERFTKKIIKSII